MRAADAIAILSVLALALALASAVGLVPRIPSTPERLVSGSPDPR